MTPRYSAAAYRTAAKKYLGERDAMRYQQQQAELNSEKQRAARFDIGIAAMQRAADRHLELAKEAEREAGE